MRKSRTFTKGEELLAQILDECLDEDLSFVPPEREIARNHRFTEGFEQFMKELRKSGSVKESEGMSDEAVIQKHFSPRYGQWAACILVFCLCGWLFCTVVGPIADKSGGGAAQESASEGSADSAAAVTEEAAPKEAPEMPEAEQGVGGIGEGEAPASETTYCGQAIALADQQEVPETLEYVTTLVNCPVLDEENPIFYLTIGNTGEQSVRYLDRYDLEVWIDGGWYVIPSKTDREGRWRVLEAKMAVDEEIDLDNYEIDYGAQQYRLVTQVNEGLISAEFTFEEVFEKTMEELEAQEESSGE